MNESKLVISSSPHIRGRDSVSSVMFRVIAALMPALFAGIRFFGLRALWVTLVSTGSCVFFEWGYRRLAGKNCTIGDGSAALTGLLLGMTLSPAVPLWLPVLGGFFAVVVVKQLYGGLGKNFLNPALAARCFLFAWTPLMTVWLAPRGVDAVSSATPLAVMKGLALPSESLLDCFLGFKPGCIGEVSCCALLIGGVFLLACGIIKPHIPLSYLAAVAVLTFLFPRGNERLAWMSYQLLSGGLQLGAWFMATDYVTSPVTGRGQILYGAGCGALTVFIRYFCSYPEGVSFSILLMNLTVWLIDKRTAPRAFGYAKEGKK